MLVVFAPSSRSLDIYRPSLLLSLLSLSCSTRPCAQLEAGHIHSQSQSIPQLPSRGGSQLYLGPRSHVGEQPGLLVRAGAASQPSLSTASDSNASPKRKARSKGKGRATGSQTSWREPSAPNDSPELTRSETRAHSEDTPSTLSSPNTPSQAQGHTRHIDPVADALAGIVTPEHEERLHSLIAVLIGGPLPDLGGAPTVTMPSRSGGRRTTASPRPAETAAGSSSCIPSAMADVMPDDEEIRQAVGCQAAGKKIVSIILINSK